jgi:hypothetical protein
MRATHSVWQVEKFPIFASLKKSQLIPERCQSGRTYKLGKFVYLQGYRGFESHPLRKCIKNVARFCGLFCGQKQVKPFRLNLVLGTKKSEARHF